MQNNQFSISYIISILLITVFLVLFGFTPKAGNEPIEVYNVYLKGNIIGVVQNKKEFEDLL